VTFNDALLMLAAREDALREERLPAGQLHVEDGTLLAGDARYRLQGDGLGRLCRRMGAPPAYLHGMEERIRSVVLQHHLDRGDLGAETVTIFSRDGEFVGFGRPELLRLGGPTILQAVVDGVGRELDVHQLHHGEESFQIDLLGHEAGEEVAPGDVLRAGLRVTHSLTGEHATWIEAFVFRLV
jgi:hypothetical protein